ncbi:biliverdin-producing heme oxygenase [Pseudomonas typographi]|uniref:biliverdin-producing heme oxygenase n=1 Tax=Pseudomonas typographi TaxID=2715964 RepID=UPI001EEEB944|nr:biliverdin-producing heme oxygenase [Pseudomonas typographi]
MQASPALSALRDATRDLHAGLDRHSPLTAAQLDIATYARHAYRVLGWMQPMEASLYGAATPVEWRRALGAERRAHKVHWLRQDLLDSAHTQPVEPCPFAPHPHSLAEAFGLSYVCEGATLGGAYLFKQWQNRLQPLQLHWLRGYGEHTGALWRAWQQALAEHVRSPEDIHAAAAAACVAFESFRRWVVDMPAHPASP